jgi:hypothetical protein
VIDDVFIFTVPVGIDFTIAPTRLSAYNANDDDEDISLPISDSLSCTPTPVTEQTNVEFASSSDASHAASSQQFPSQSTALQPASSQLPSSQPFLAQSAPSLPPSSDEEECDSNLNCGEESNAANDSFDMDWVKLEPKPPSLSEADHELSACFVAVFISIFYI